MFTRSTRDHRERAIVQCRLARRRLVLDGEGVSVEVCERRLAAPYLRIGLVGERVKARESPELARQIEQVAVRRRYRIARGAREAAGVVALGDRDGTREPPERAAGL